MAGTQVQLRRGTTAEHSTFTGAVGEVTVDTTKDTLVVHDGSTAGGFPLAREHQILAGNSSVAVTDTGSNGTVVVTTEGTERMRVDSSGNVGIGTNSPETLLHVKNSSNYHYTVFDGLTGTDITFRTNGASEGYIGTWTANTLYIGAGYSSNVGNVVFETSDGTERMRITSAGNVGIGTSDTLGWDVLINRTGNNADLAVSRTSGALTALWAGATEGWLYTETNHPLVLGTNDTERMRITAAGDVLVTGAGGLGYGAGSGGSVTQATSRTTGVTLNKTNGAITMFSAAGSTTAASFTVTNSTVAATDTIILNHKAASNLYDLMVTDVAAGSFRITFRSTSGTATDAPVINFAVIKAVTS